MLPLSNNIIIKIGVGVIIRVRGALQKVVHLQGASFESVLSN